MLNQIMRLSGHSKRDISKNVAIAMADAITTAVPSFCVFFILAEMLKPNPSNQLMQWYCGVIVACLILRVIAVKACFVSHSKFSSSSGYVMRTRLMKKLTRIPLGKLLAMDLGRINNTILKDVEFTEHTLSHVISYLLGIGCVLLLFLIGLFAVDWRLALAMLVGFPLAITLFIVLSTLSERGKTALIQASDNLNSATFEYLFGIRWLRAHHQADGDMLQLKEKTKRARDAHLKFEMSASLAPAAFIVFSFVSTHLNNFHVVVPTSFHNGVFGSLVQTHF